ncbi:MAG: helix-turn-helix domain-containing protein [Nitrospirae bacterium]|nr:helix-turn-helix domain-containing protein [Nitrospirota bacterium]
MITAEKIYKEILEMPVEEREKLFAAIARKGFEKEFYTYDEVFSDIRKSPFTVKEAAKYLEVAEITVRRWVKDSILKSKRLGKNIVFDTNVLKDFKRKRRVCGKHSRGDV